MPILWSLLLLLGASGVQDSEPGGLKDSLGDPLPGGATARLGTARLLHGGLVTAVLYSPQGTILASGGCDGKVRLWEAEYGKPLQVLSIGASIYQPFISLAFSPDGLTLATRAGKELCLWSPTTGKRLGTWEVPGEGEAALAFSPDGKELGWIAPGGTLHRLDVASGKEMEAGPLPAGAGDLGFPVLGYAPDGKTILIGEGQTLRALERLGGKEILQFRGHTGRITSIACSPDGQLLATGSQDGSLRIWEMSSGEELLAMPGYNAGHIQVRFSPDGKKLISAQAPEITISLFYQPESLGKDRELHVWDVATGKKLSTLRQADPGATAFACSPDGRRLAVAGRASIHLWDLAEKRELPAGPGHRTTISAVAFSPDGKTISTAAEHDHTIRIWDVASGRELGDLEGSTPYQDAPRLVYFPDGKVIAQANTPVQMWDLATETELHWHSALDRKDLLNGHAFGFSRDGKTLAVAVPGGTLQLRAVDTGRRLLTLKGDALNITSVALSDDGKTLAAGYADESVRLWDLGTAKVRWTHTLGTVPQLGQAHTDSWARVTFLAGGKAVVGGHDGTMDVWEAATGKLVLELEGDWSDASALHFSPDGQSIAGWKKGSIQVWETATGKEVFTDPGHQGAWRGLSRNGGEAGEGLFAFSPDGRTLVSAAGGPALVWDLVGGGLPAGDLSARELDERWNDLLGGDARKARGAMQALVRAGKTSVCFLRDRLLPPRRIGAAAREKLLGDLSEEDITVRERTTQELLEQASEKDVEFLLAANASPEARARLLEILQILRRPLALSGNGLRTSRAVQVLEGIGSPEARALLGDLARGSRLERERDHAAGALSRLSLLTPEKNSK